MALSPERGFRIWTQIVSNWISVYITFLFSNWNSVYITYLFVKVRHGLSESVSFSVRNLRKKQRKLKREQNQKVTPTIMCLFYHDWGLPCTAEFPVVVKKAHAVRN